MMHVSAAGAAFKKLTESIATYDEDLGMTESELYDLGLSPWGEEPETGKKLWLFPLSYYPHIPAGFPIVYIDYRRDAFMPNVTDNDTRFGYLAFGVLGRMKSQR